MPLTWSEVNHGIKDAERTMSAADRVVGEMADLIRGKLRSGKVSGYALADLKRELRDFDLRTYCWKE